MTKQAMKKLRGWSIGTGVAVALGTVAVLSSSKSAEEKAVEDMYIEEIVQFNDTSSMVYPSIFDAAVISNFSVEEIREAIRTNDTLDGYEFDVKR